ncbi:MAG TPA: DUF58 domain-containing protein [Blastocatellia bacterium]|jgi:uncharacterized protein (DUF58 family)|nr:DUF58 domain-containing protein [Blastocatellia bacterium]
MMQASVQQTGARFLAPEVLARISSLELVARSVVEGFISGLHRSPHLGFSTDFAEHRQYMPGDDLRHLDWKLLARTDRLYIKKYQGDTNAQLHLLVDASASMGYSSGEVTKLQYAQYLAASLGFLGVRQHDSVGLGAFDEQMVEHVPPSSRSGHLRTVLGVLERLVPGRGTALSAQLHRMAELLTRRGIVVLISDLYDEPERIMEGLEHLRFRGNDVIVFQVMDRQELDFEFFEPVVLEDSETEEQLHVLPDVVREEYLRAMKAHTEALKDGAARNRIDYELLRTTEPLDAALFSYLGRRSQFG